MKSAGRYILLLMLSLCALASAAQNSDVKSARERAVEYYYLEAISRYEQDSLDTAYEMLEHCLALDSASLPVKYELAAYYQVLGKDSIACELLESIVREEPSNMRYCDALVAYYDRHGDTDSAIEVYEMVLRNGNTKPEVYKVLSHLYSSQGEYHKAIEMLDKIELLEGPDENVSLFKVYQYVSLKDSLNALSVTRDLIGTYPDNQQYRNLLGEVYAYFNDIENAENAYISALQNDSDDVLSMSSLAALYLTLGDDSLYCSMVERMLKSERLDTEQRSSLLYEYVVHKESSDTSYMKGLFKELMELPFDQVEIAEIYAQYLIYHNESNDAVIPVVERILQLDPENNSALLQMLKYAIESNDYAAVIKRCDDALLYIPDMLAIYYYKGLASYLLGDKEAIIPIYEQGLRHRTEEDSPEVVAQMFSTLGDVYHETGNFEKCVEAYDTALVYEPYNVNVLNNYAYYLSLEGQELERALEMSAMTLEQEPDEAIYIDTYAWILFTLERYEEALAYAEKLVVSNSDMSAVVCHHCGDIFAKNGDMERAVEMWQRAYDLGDDSKVLKKKIKKRKYYSDDKKKRK